MFFSWFVMGYAAHRITYDERAGSRGFLANLPREQGLVFWAHVSWLGVFSLFLQVLIFLGVWILNLSDTESDAAYVLPAGLLSFVASACVIWLPAVLSSGLGRAAAVFGMAILFMGSQASGFLWQRAEPTVLGDGARVVFAPGVSLVVALLAAGLLWHTYRKWNREQLGEVA